jgi:hypothetical protein
MTLSDGDPADNNDIWFRVVTQKDHIKNGRVHHGAFTGRAIASPNPCKNRSWQRELSGRLRSRAGTVNEITRHAEAYCAENTRPGGNTKTFHGLIYSRVANIKLSYKDKIRLGAHFTPLPNDQAHADLTFTGWHSDTKDDRDEFILWLSDKLQALHHPGQLQLLPEVRLESALSRLKKLAMSFVTSIRKITRRKRHYCD